MTALRPSLVTPGAFEQAVARVFSEVLVVDGVGADDNLYDLGGSSLAAGEIAARLRHELGCDVNFGDVLGNPSVRLLAEHLAGGAAPQPGLGASSVGGRPPASFQQQSLWVIDQFEGPSPRYNESLALRMRGPLDVAALERALGDVVARHAPLRTNVRMCGDDLVQCAAGASEARARIDLKRARADEESLADRIGAAALEPFDLERDVLLRPWLFEIDGDDHVLLVVLHHLAFDGASVAPFWRDLALAYNGRVRGHPPLWAPLPVQYADYAVWQRARLEGPAGEAGAGALAQQAAFWRDVLSGAPVVSPLPTDRPRPAERSCFGGRAAVEVPPPLHRRVARLATTHRLTTFMAVHAALVVALARRGAGRDIVVGTVVAGRNDRVLDDLVGFFATTVALRVETAPEMPLAELAERVRATDLAAFAHQDLPFERVVDALAPDRSSTADPFVQVFLVLQPRPPAPPTFSGLEARFVDHHIGTTKFDICLDLVELVDQTGRPAGIVGGFDFAADIFDACSVAELHAAFEEALEALAAIAGDDDALG